MVFVGKADVKAETVEERKEVSRETDIKGGSSVDWGRGEARWLCTKNLG
jgi:hypothetical protein